MIWYKKSYVVEEKGKKLVFGDSSTGVGEGKKYALSGNRTHVFSATTRYPNHWMMKANNFGKLKLL